MLAQQRLWIESGCWSILRGGGPVDGQPAGGSGSAYRIQYATPGGAVFGLRPLGVASSALRLTAPCPVLRLRSARSGLPAVEVGASGEMQR